VTSLLGWRRRRSPDLSSRLVALQAAAAELRGTVPDGVTAEVEALVERAGERVVLGVDRTVVALAGSTGSGKSSLFNAVVGIDLAVTGVRRPTTAEPLACVWGQDGSGPLLDWLGVPPAQRVAHESELDPHPRWLGGLVLLDLPDHDSMVRSHRAEVDRLVALVDLLVWVVDPQKYADAVLHEEYLRAMSGHGGVVVVVLNQVDRLSADQRDACLADLTRLLERDGLADVPVLAVSAASGEGLATVTTLLERAVRGRRSAAERLAADVSALGSRLAAAAGLGEVVRSGHDQPAPAAPAEDRLIGEVAQAVGVDGLGDLVRTAQQRRAQDAVGWPGARLVRRARGLPPEPEDAAAVALAVSDAPPVVQARVDLAVRDYVQVATAGLPPGWRREVEARVDPGPSAWTQALARDVVAAAAEPVPAPRWWTAQAALQAVASTVAGVGLVWLLALLVLGVGTSGAPSAPTIGGLPWPGVLALGGLVLSVLLSLVVWTVPSRWADHAGARAEQAMTARVRQAVHEKVVAPVRAELERRDRAVQALRHAIG
jgi:GTP-binding protein EngB required for normal cell division